MTRTYALGDILELSFDDVQALPIGTVVRAVNANDKITDSAYVKTRDAAWAFLWGRRILTAAHVESAVRMQHNNISPGPCSERVRIVALPKSQPGVEP